jgi:hypothetical protein
MKTTAKWQVILGLFVVAAIAGPIQSAAADAPAASLSFTIHVLNYAGVGPQTLAEAEKVASRIFLKAGVVSQWIDAPLTEQDLQKASVDQQSVGLSQIWLSLLPRTMSDRMSIPAGVTGLAPGAGPDRFLAYVFYNRVEELRRKQIAAMLSSAAATHASVGQILGGAMTHEIGHILLNLAVHSKTGIMQGSWNLDVLDAIGCDHLYFTKEQEKVMQAEVARRVPMKKILAPAADLDAGF